MTIAKKTITTAQHEQLVLLLKEAKAHNWRLNQLAGSVRAIIGDVDRDGESTNAVYSGYTAAELLETLGVNVAPETS